ncbi:restriction endonuclease subunit S [Gemmiger formicilis]|uniref:restriction endonuclease subunit S n=1 Tax=Gemmiger formicilis TaxID=745368 RepID=UPI00195731A3|nr:restriction endonuclease subunit S [Gemmiger formicilis]MBM6900562.1 restriction endonuclease subunit S [Gemmiger formicilis]
MAKLGDVFTLIRNGASIKQTEGAGGFPITRIETIANRKVDHKKFGYADIVDITKYESYVLQDGDILMSHINSEKHLGKVALYKKQVNEQIIHGMNLLVLRANPKILLSDYAAYFFETPGFLRQIQKITKKSVNQASFTVTALKELEIPLPSLDEQRRIAAVLDKVTDLIAQRRAQLDKLDLLVEALFNEMFGDPILNTKEFPVYKMKDVVQFEGGSQPDKSFFEYSPTENNVRLIQIRDYKSNKFITYIPKSLARRFCTADDIMIGRYGPPIFQILGGIDGAYNVALMKATPKMGNREFIRHFLKQKCLLHYLEGLSKRTAGQDGIQMDKLKEYPVPYPPVELQNQFSSFVEQTEKSKLTILESLDKLEMIKKALMQNYFG